jgi:predicted RNase H-like nuclease (RuvC/YqgF family)
MPETKKRGRPATGAAMTGAERQRQYMERLKARTAPAPDQGEPEALRRELAEAIEEVARLNRENDRLAIENDTLKRRLKAMDSRETDLCKRLDAAVAERDQAREAKVRAEADLALSRH